MTPAQAAMILEVSPGSGRARINEAHSARCRSYLVRVQHATKPDEREIAKRALGLLQDAYYALTGQRPPGCLAPARRPGPVHAELAPRITLNQRASPGRGCQSAAPGSTKTSVPDRFLRPVNGIPRASLGTGHSVAAAPSAKPLATAPPKSTPATSSGFHASTGRSGSWREGVVGVLIFLAICLLALLILGKGIGCGP